MSVHMQARDDTVRKAAGVSGIVFAVLLVVGVALGGGAPMANKPAAKIVKWYSDHRGVALLSWLLTGIGLIFFLTFLGYLYKICTERSRSGLAPIMGLTGVATLVIATVTTLPVALLALQAGRSATPNDSVVYLLADINNLSGVAIGAGLALFLAVLGFFLRDALLAPRWAGWVAWAGSLANLLGAIGAAFPSRSGKTNPLGIFGLLGLVLFLVTIVAVAVELLRQPAPVIEPFPPTATR